MNVSDPPLAVDGDRDRSGPVATLVQRGRIDREAPLQIFRIPTEFPEFMKYRPGFVRRTGPSPCGWLRSLLTMLTAGIGIPQRPARRILVVSGYAHSTEELIHAVTHPLALLHSQSGRRGSTPVRPQRGRTVAAWALGRCLLPL